MSISHFSTALFNSSNSCGNVSFKSGGLMWILRNVIQKVLTFDPNELLRSLTTSNFIIGLPKYKKLVEYFGFLPLQKDVKTFTILFSMAFIWSSGQINDGRVFIQNSTEGIKTAKKVELIQWIFVPNHAKSVPFLVFIVGQYVQITITIQVYQIDKIEFPALKAADFKKCPLPP